MADHSTGNALGLFRHGIGCQWTKILRVRSKLGKLPIHTRLRRHNPILILITALELKPNTLPGMVRGKPRIIFLFHQMEYAETDKNETVPKLERRYHELLALYS